MTVSSEFVPLAQALRTFALERDWAQFHTPKNLACALSVEAAELLEHCQWLSEEQSRVLEGQRKQAVAAEVAHVFLYLLQLCDRLEIDLMATAWHKLQVNTEKYRVFAARRNSRKYTEL